MNRNEPPARLLWQRAHHISGMEAQITTPEIEFEAQEKGIRRRQMGSLVALYASVIIGWIAYKNYQPKLLVQFQFTDFTFLLMFAQGVILVITPMIAGKLGDYYRFRAGHRLPVISAGISFAAMVFMAVAFTLLSDPGEIFKWLLPVLIILWLVSMSIFTSPALSTMELFTPIDKLPYAMAILTITGNLLYAIEPVIVDIIEFVGAPGTFILGGAVVFISGYALKKTSMDLFRISDGKEQQRDLSGPAASPYGSIFFAGLCIGLATAILFYLIPSVAGGYVAAFSGLDATLLIVVMLAVSALVSWPMGGLVNRYGVARSFWFSMGCLLISTGAIYLVKSAAVMVPMLLVFSLAYTSLSVAGLPMAIKSASQTEKVFCVGIFFSGVALPEAVYEAFMAWAP